MTQRKTPDKPSTILTAEEVAERWRCDPGAVRRQLHLGKLPGFQPTGNSWRIRLEDVEAHERKASNAAAVRAARQADAARQAHDLEEDRRAS